MSLIDRLTQRPGTTPPTLPLIRVRNVARGTILSSKPLFLPSHWRSSRSFPCTAELLGSCPWCVATPRREHAYIAATLLQATTRPRTIVLELPPHTLPTPAQLYGVCYLATRRSHRAPIVVELSTRPDNAPAPPPAIATDEILRTLRKVYHLPDPAAYRTEDLWLLDLKARVEHPDYTPQRALNPKG